MFTPVNRALVQQGQGEPQAQAQAQPVAAAQAQRVGNAVVNIPAPAPDVMQGYKAAFQEQVNDLFAIIGSDIPNTTAPEFTPSGDNQLKFTINLPSKIQGEIGNLKRDHSGKKRGFEAAEGAKISVEQEVKGTIDVATGEITFEGNPIKIVKNGIPVSLEKIHMNTDGSFGRLTIKDPLLGRATVVSTPVVNSENFKATLEVIQWQDATNAMPAIMGELTPKAALEQEDKASKTKKAQGTLNYVNTKKTNKDISDEELFKFLADKDLLKKVDYKFIGRKKHGESLHLEDNFRSRLSGERKMLEGAEQLKGVNFAEVPQENLEQVIKNLEAIRLNMFNSAPTKEGKEQIWNLMTESINAARKVQNPPTNKSCFRKCGSGLVTLMTNPSSFLSKKARRAWLRNRGTIGAILVPVLAFGGSRLIGII